MVLTSFKTIIILIKQGGLNLRNNEIMMGTILDFARNDERIRAVYMNGSRTNPNVPKDIFQDYDIVYVVTETTPFIEEQSWIKHFGEILMMQEPDKNDFGDEDVRDQNHYYAFLMLFTDGNRIDLTLQSREAMLEVYGTDSLTIPLLDKDGMLPTIPPSSDINYHVKPPTEADYYSYTNDFWWCLQNVAKGIWRDELPFVKQMFEHPIRESLDQVVCWWIGMHHDFQVSPGKSGKYFKNYLPEKYWNMYKKSYTDANNENMWESVFITCDLFRMLAQEVADQLNFTYPMEDDLNMTKYLKQVRNLPKDANNIFYS